MAGRSIRIHIMLSVGNLSANRFITVKKTYITANKRHATILCNMFRNNRMAQKSCCHAALKFLLRYFPNGSAIIAKPCSPCVRILAETGMRSFFAHAGLTKQSNGTTESSH